MVRLLLAALAAVALTAFASPASAAEPCPKGVRAVALHLTPEVTRQGATLKVSAVALTEDNPWGVSAPIACLKGWKVSDPAIARLSSDRGRLIIAETAPVGAKVTLTASLRGNTAEVAFTVVAKDAVVLTGFWSEVGEADCPAGEPPLRELRFLGDGQFEATWTPFERYVDYWGTYVFDPASGAIRLTPTGGNRIPADADLEGRAALGADGLLRLTGVFFGSPTDPPLAPRDCPLVFKPR